MQDRLVAALRQLNTPYAEIRLERCDSTSIVYRGDQLETIDTSIDYGGFARALATQGGWGATTFTGDENLRAHVLDAIRLAHTIDSDPITLAPITPITDRVCADLSIDFRSIPLAQKRALIAHYNDQLLHFDPRIETTYVSYFETFITTWFANTDGTLIYQERPLIDLQLTALARNGDTVRRGSKSLALSRGYEAVIDRSDLARAAAQLAIEQLSARKVRSRRYTVVLDPIMAGLFTHEAFGHLSEADFIAENPQAQAMMTLGRQFGPRNLNIFDDGATRQSARQFEVRRRRRAHTEDVADARWRAGGAAALARDGRLDERTADRQRPSDVVSLRATGTHDQHGYRALRWRLAARIDSRC